MLAGRGSPGAAASRGMAPADDRRRRGRHHDGQRSGREALGQEGFLDAADIMVGHPVAHEGLGGADLQFVGVEGFQAQRADPGIEHRIAQFPAHALAHRRPGRPPVRHRFSVTCTMSTTHPFVFRWPAGFPCPVIPVRAVCSLALAPGQIRRPSIRRALPRWPSLIPVALKSLPRY